MLHMTVNQSDRQIVDTGGTSDTSYRLTDVPVVGVEYTPPEQTEPSSGTESDPAESSDIGIARNIQIESQVVRIQADGSAVVDVTASFDTADGATKHEVRLSKI